MAKLTIKEVEEVEVQIKGEPTKIKKCLIEQEGFEHPHKRVTVWNNYPEYQGVQAGAVFEHSHVEVKDSKTPNPHGGFYKNRTLMYGQKSEDSGLVAKVDNLMTSLGKAFERIDALEAKAGITRVEEVPTESYDDTDSIDPNLIPF